MHIQKLLHEMLTKALPEIHKKRINALLNAVSSLMMGKKLSLTHLGRSMLGKAKERHCIRKMDRLLGNEKLFVEQKSFYKFLAIKILSDIVQPILNVDWACVNKKKGLYILRASLPLKGRGLVIYQKTYPVELENSPKAHLEFLVELKSILPSCCKPILVTDAGFRCPWFKAVRELGFDFVGRLRNKTGYKFEANQTWESDCLMLYKQATNIPTFLGQILLAKSSKINCALILYKKVKKNRKHLNRLGNPSNNTQSNRSARNKKDPWLLVTSLNTQAFDAKKIMMIYKKRMQIEEEFRDLKSHQYGFGLRYSQSVKTGRIDILLLIAALASFACWLIAICAKKENKQWDYQANSIKTRDILSPVYLACQLLRKGVSFCKKALISAFNYLPTLCRELNCV